LFLVVLVLLVLLVLVAIVLYIILAPTGLKRQKKPYDLSEYNLQLNRSNLSQPPVSKPVIDDYNDYLLTAGLESSVVDSHRQFVSDIQKTTTGASAQTVMSGDVLDNPFVGLRRPNYNVAVDPNARQVPSAFAHQYSKNSRYDHSGLF
jgi:hypothetical protein